MQLLIEWKWRVRRVREQHHSCSTLCIFNHRADFGKFLRGTRYLVTQHWCSLYKIWNCLAFCFTLRHLLPDSVDLFTHTETSKKNILKEYLLLQQTLPNRTLLFHCEMWQLTLIFVSSWSRMYDCSTFQLWVVSLLIKTCNIGLFLWSQPHHIDRTGKCLYGISSFNMKLLIKL